MNLAAITSPTSPTSVEKIAELSAARGSPSSRKPLSGAALRNASAAEQRTAVAQQFEAILVRQLLNKTMTSMLGSEKSGASANVYGDMLTDSFAQQLTAGSGLGFGKMLEKQLTPRGFSAVTSPADTSSTEAHP
jgi:flagellar protein FlgJ